jgi:Zinc carboxypeptidase
MDNWITHFEKSGETESPSYEETIKYFKRFETESNMARLISLGKSSQGREIKCLVVAKGNHFTPQRARRSGKAIVLIQNGIHPGEIEGKDASMLLLREILITKEKKNLLDNLVLLFIPVFNVDGHERLSPYNRPNQNGPRMMGFRTTAINLNLNRDYMKADTPEMKSLLRLFSTWLPDLYIDNHTTNGTDYQYHITYGMEKHQVIFGALGNWGQQKFLPFVKHEVEKKGFLSTTYIEMKGSNIKDGITEWASRPMFSTGYSALQNRLLLLIETHSLKPFSNRVYSTKAMVEATLEFINQNYKELKDLNRKADRESVKKYADGKTSFPIKFEGTDEYEMMNFKGIEYLKEESKITGSSIKRYTGKPIDIQIPVYNKVKITNRVKLPFAYLIPKEFKEEVRILKLHGIKAETLTEEKSIKVEKYHFIDFKFAEKPYEGRQGVQVKCETINDTMVFPAGTYIIKTKQRGIRVIANLLEPQASDSFLSWGFFNAFFERKEYAEDFVMEPIAKKMIEENPNLKKEFEAKLNNDENFRNNPLERLDYFYKKSVYFDRRENIYPIFRLMDKIDI